MMDQGNFTTLILAICLAACFRALIVNHRTHTQRRSMFPDVGDPDFWPKVEALNSVTYDRHMWAALTFRDPLKLYPPILFDQTKRIET